MKRFFNSTLSQTQLSDDVIKIFQTLLLASDFTSLSRHSLTEKKCWTKNGLSTFQLHSKVKLRRGLAWIVTPARHLPRFTEVGWLSSSQGAWVRVVELIWVKRQKNNIKQLLLRRTGSRFQQKSWGLWTLLQSADMRVQMLGKDARVNYLHKYPVLFLRKFVALKHTLPLCASMEGSARKGGRERNIFFCIGARR